MRDFEIIEPFRTPILTKQWPDSAALDGALESVIRARMASSAGVQASNRGGWHSEGNMAEWDEPSVQELMSRARAMSEAFVDDIMTIPKAAYHYEWELAAWCVVSRRGDFSIPHLHPSASWSGVYYVRAEAPPAASPQAGCLAIQDPRVGISMARPEAMYGHTWHRLTPRSGLMVLFPSWLTHFAHPHEGEDDRIVIAFDAHMTVETYDTTKLIGETE